MSSSTTDDQDLDLIRPVIGWREWVSFPELGLDWVKVKVDTGARSSSIHTESIVHFVRDGQPWVRFEILPWQGSKLDAVVGEAPVLELRHVRSSTGETEERIVIRANIKIGNDQHEIDLTLTRRDLMGFRMLLGREAIRSRFVVDPGRSYLLGRPSKAVRAVNKMAE